MNKRVRGLGQGGLWLPQRLPGCGHLMARSRQQAPGSSRMRYWSFAISTRSRNSLVSVITP